MGIIYPMGINFCCIGVSNKEWRCRATPSPSPSASSYSSPPSSTSPTSAADPSPLKPAEGNPNSDNSTKNNIYLPRIIFIAEDDENESENVIVGLEQAVINSYPKLVFSKRNENWGNDAVCSICLCEYRESEMLPDWKHCFHVMCADAWLKLNASCSVCRNSSLPTPLSTSLQEVVPLSQYADGRRPVTT